MREGSAVKLSKDRIATPHLHLAISSFVVMLWGGAGLAQAQSDERTQVQLEASSAEKLSKNWIGFRGFGSLGHATGVTPPNSWSVETGKNIRWKVAVAKHGMSSPVVWQDRVFLTGADEVSRDVYCFDAASGRLIWQHAVSSLPDSPDEGGLPRVLDATGYAAPTMATNGQVVVAIFATGELVGLSMDGERVWSKHLGVPDNHYGHASSLITDGELLFVQLDQKENARVFALQMQTGESVWEQKRDGLSWASPILVTNHGRTELILTDNKSVASYDPKTGERHWRVECLSGEVASSAGFSGDFVFVASEGAFASAIDISDHSAQPDIRWQWDESLPDASSLVANKDCLLVPTAFGVVTCLARETGEVLWEHEFNRGFTSSPILVEDRVYMVDLSGTTQVFKLSKEFELLSESGVGEPVYATPAFSGNRILIRGLTHLFCIAADE